ncbi:MAG: hypothetical protein Q7T48_15700 [Cellvibrio sp.]|uniref:hypothetical protein n=1 Tax=Cellvibrio sp. TaxID=1965322 RepID=UPI00271FB6B3|nr:hypothetical protein [Cellvibrio sp.]
MKLNKTLLAAVIAAASVPAMAAELDFSGTGETIVLANVIFGEGAPGVGSEETLITAPEVTFDLVVAAGPGDIGLAAEKATVKFTLGGAAVFGEDLSTTTLLDNANGAVGAFSLVAGVGAVTYEVVQGGAIGDNTITLELTFGADADTLESVTFTGYKVKNLTSALKPSSSNPVIELGVEYVESDSADADDVASTATDAPIAIFGSQEPLNLNGTSTDFDANPFLRINVGNGEMSFTDGVDGRTDFDPENDSIVKLGTLQLGLENIDLGDFPGSSGGAVRKENGNAFDFQGGDKHALKISAGAGAFQTGAAGASIYLSDDNCVTKTTDLTFTGETLTATQYSTSVSGNTTALTANYSVCYAVNGTAAIPEVSGITATWSVDFFNTRYDNRDLSYSAYGPLKRNGCVASLFNIPGSTNTTDTAFVRLTNTSITNTGDIRGTLYAQDGTVLGADVTIAPALPIHATQVFSSLAEDAVSANGTIVSIEKAFGVTAADYKGRARLVLKGAFDTCEAMGLIRNSSTGALYNMTSTTQGNEAAAPNDGNNAN